MFTHVLGGGSIRSIIGFGWFWYLGREAVVFGDKDVVQRKVFLQEGA